MNPKAIILATLIATASSATLAGGYYPPIDINPDTPHIENLHLGDDTPSKGSSSDNGSDVILTPELVDALGPGEPGPASPQVPGGILTVDDNPPIIILDDGVGSGGPGQLSPDGKAGDALVIRLACSIKGQGLVLTNTGETDAPAGLKLRWRAGAGHGSVRLDRTLDAGDAALLPGIAAAAGSACGITLLS